MVAVLSSPLFDNNFPLDNTTKIYNSRDAHDAVANVTVGAAPGATATANRAQVSNHTQLAADDGGKRKINTISDINRATTAQDVTNLKNEVKRRNAGGLVYAKDLSGNGGPAFTRT